MEGLAEQVAERLAEQGMAPEQPDSGEQPDQEEQDTQPNIEGREADPQSEEATPEPDQQPDSESDDVGVEMLTDLAKILDVEPETLYNLKIKPDSGDAITIGEFKDKIQEIERREGELRDQYQRSEQERAQILGQMQQYQQPMQQLDQEGQEAQKELQLAEAEFQRINWEELEKIDAGRAALEQQKLLRRHAVARKKVDEARARTDQLRQHQMMQFKAAHDQELLKRIPEWRDQKVAEREVHGMVDWVRNNYQFSDQEIGQTIDWRHRDIIRKAYLYDQIRSSEQKLKSEAPVKIGRGVKLPKRDHQADQVNELVQKAKQGGSREEKIAAASAILRQSFASRTK
jgi:hypothetical protein